MGARDGRGAPDEGRGRARGDARGAALARRRDGAGPGGDTADGRARGARPRRIGRGRSDSRDRIDRADERVRDPTRGPTQVETLADGQKNWTGKYFARRPCSCAGDDGNPRGRPEFLCPGCGVASWCSAECMAADTEHAASCEDSRVAGGAQYRKEFYDEDGAARRRRLYSGESRSRRRRDLSRSARAVDPDGPQATSWRKRSSRA